MASAVIGALRVNLGIDSAEFQDGLKKANNGLTAFANAAKLAGLAIATAFAAGIGKAVGRVETMEAATRRLDKALSNAGNAAKTSGNAVADWADKLERRTGRAAEEVMAVGANLASFNFGEEIFFRAIELGDDMSAAWGGDLRSNLEGLSRALDDPENGFAMLRKRGIALTDTQEKLVDSLIASNDKLGAQKVVLQALEEQVKGVAEAGFQGLTKSVTNLGVAIEGFFDKIVQSTGFGTMLAVAIDIVTAAVDHLTQNLGAVVEAAAFVGGALTLAFSPVILGSIGSITAAIGIGMVGAMRALSAAIAANPLGALALAITGAVAAAYYFRDEIQKAFGVDVVGIVKGAGNLIINSFRAAFEDIKFVWMQLPNIMGAAALRAANAVISSIAKMVNASVQGINDLIAMVPTWLGGGGGGISFRMEEGDRWKNTFADELAKGIDGRNGRIAAIMGSDPLGNIGEAFKTSTPGVENFASALAAANAELDEMGGGGKGGKLDAIASEAARIFEQTRTPLERYESAIARLNGLLASGAISQDTYNRAVIQAEDAFDRAQEAGKKAENTFARIGQSIAQSIGSAFQSLIDGGKKFSDVLSDILGQLGQMILNSGFQSLFGGGTGGSGSGSGIGAFFKNLFGFARGGTIFPGGAGGVDSQLVAFRKSPNERVDITKPGQSLTAGVGAGKLEINVNVSGARGNQEIMQMVESGVRRGIGEYRQGMVQDDMAAFVSDARVR